MKLKARNRRRLERMMCDEFYIGLELGYIHRNSIYNFEIIKDYTSTFDGCFYIKINYCPFCGKKLSGR